MGDKSMVGDGWLPAACVELSGDDLDEIGAAILSRGAGSGPVHPVTSNGQAGTT